MVIHLLVIHYVTFSSISPIYISMFLPAPNLSSHSSLFFLLSEIEIVAWIALTERGFVSLFRAYKSHRHSRSVSSHSDCERLARLSGYQVVCRIPARVSSVSPCVISQPMCHQPARQLSSDTTLPRTLRLYTVNRRGRGSVWGWSRRLEGWHIKPAYGVSDPSPVIMLANRPRLDCVKIFAIVIPQTIPGSGGNCEWQVWVVP